MMHRLFLLTKTQWHPTSYTTKTLVVVKLVHGCSLTILGQATTGKGILNTIMLLLQEKYFPHMSQESTFLVDHLLTFAMFWASGGSSLESPGQRSLHRHTQQIAHVSWIHKSAMSYNRIGTVCTLEYTVHEKEILCTLFTKGNILCIIHI